MMPSFTFQTLEQKGLTIPVDTIFDSLSKYQKSSNRLQMLVGVTQRSDLTRKTINILLDEVRKYSDSHLDPIWVNLFNNPVIDAYPDIKTKILQNYVTENNLYNILCQCDNLNDYLTSIIITSTRQTSHPKTIYKLIHQRFSESEIDDAINQLVDAAFKYFITHNSLEPSCWRVFKSPYIKPQHMEQAALILEKMIEDSENTNAISAAYSLFIAINWDRKKLTRRTIEIIVNILLVFSQNKMTCLNSHLQQFNVKTQKKILLQPVLAKNLKWGDLHWWSHKSFLNATRKGADPFILSGFHEHFTPDLINVIIDSLIKKLETVDQPDNSEKIYHFLRTTLLPNSGRLGTNHEFVRLWNLWNEVSPEEYVDSLEFIKCLGELGRLSSGEAEIPVAHRIAEWASLSENPELRQHAVKQIYDVDQLTSAASDLSPLVREKVLSHPQLTYDILKQLANDSNVNIRAKTVMHPKTDHIILSLLAADPEPCIRANVLRNPKTSMEVVENLLQDSEEIVVDAAKERVLDVLKTPTI